MRIKKEFENVIKEVYITNYTRIVIATFLAYKKYDDITKKNFENIIDESNGKLNCLMMS